MSLKTSLDIEVPVSTDLFRYLIFLKTGTKTKNYIEGISLYSKFVSSNYININIIW